MKCKELIENSKLTADAKQALHNTIANMDKKNIKEVDKLFLREIDAIKTDRTLLKIESDEILTAAREMKNKKISEGG